MYRFYVEAEKGQHFTLGEKIQVTGSDVNHIKNVLRMKENEKIIICDGQGNDFYCIIQGIFSDEIVVMAEKTVKSEAELPAKLYLFQGIPKRDKMEWILQKAVELGVFEVIPVFTKRTIVKLEDKKKEARKMERWQTIANSAAKQSGRGILPLVNTPCTFLEAVSYAKSLDYVIIPYENAHGMEESRSILKSFGSNSSIGIFIGPEGGFEESEIEEAKAAGMIPVTLGKRILRTETAGLTVLSILMFALEQ